MDSIKKKIAPWEINYGQTSFAGHDYPISKKLFADYIGRTFNLDTFLGTFPNRHFVEDGTRLRLACGPFFRKLHEGDIIYFEPSDPNTIRISREEPKGKKAAGRRAIENEIPKGTRRNISNLIVELYRENRQLREQNEELIEYKDRLEKFERLDYIFEDESFMEDWLERNIHKAVANLQVIDRQPVVTWGQAFMRNRPDFFCLDKTTHELVIVENKVRGRNKRFETQYLTYKAWAKPRIGEINKKYAGKGLKATENFRFVVITDTSDERLVSICEDNGIALILIDGGVVFEPLVSYSPQ